MNRKSWNGWVLGTAAVIAVAASIWVALGYHGRMTRPTDNPLTEITLEIPFEEIQPDHVEPAIDALIEDAQQEIDAIADDAPPRTYANTLHALEEATEKLEFAMTVVDHLESVATTPELRETYNRARPKASAFWSAVSKNQALYAALKDFAQTPEAKSLDPTRRRFLTKTLDDFRRNGAELDDAGRKRLEAIDVELTQLTTKFSQNVLDATNAFELLIEDEAKLAGLPETARAAAREDAQRKGLDGWRFTLQAPSLTPLLTYLDDRKIREDVWRAYGTRATSGEHDNRGLIVQILELRREKAAMLGYTDFSDLVLEDRMAKQGDRAEAFVEDLRERTQAAFERENRELAEFAGIKLEPWDIAYYAEKQRKALYDFDEEELRPYFPLDRVMAGMFEIVERLYRVQIREREAPVWDDAVRAYELLDAQGNTFALFYVDLFPRENKRGGAWMHPMISAVVDSGQSSPHLGVFCANVNRPVGDKPALLTHREVETLFHEFGHLLHHSFSQVSVRTLAGTNVAWDFVELPSQIMENWCWEREALDLFAAHYETGEKIPDELFQKMKRARTYRAANAQMRQLGFARFDLALHRKYNAARDGDVIEYAREILQAHSPAKLPDDYAMVASFGHLFAGAVGYAAGYYSYKWAEVLDADAFTRFKTEGIIDPSVGESFREEILEKGDSKDPALLYEAFMGREPNLDALLERAGLQ